MFILFAAKSSSNCLYTATDVSANMKSVQIDGSLKITRSLVKEQLLNESSVLKICQKPQPGTLAADIKTQCMINKKAETLKQSIIDKLAKRRAAIVPKEAKDSTAANNKSKVCDENNQVVKIEHTGLRISSKKKLNLKDDNSIRFRVNRASSLQKHTSVFEEADEHSCSSEILTAEHVLPASLDSRAKETNKVNCSSGVNVVHKDRRKDEDGLTSSAKSLPCDNWNRKSVQIDGSLKITNPLVKEQLLNESSVLKICQKPQPGTLAADIKTQCMINKKAETLKQSIIDKLAKRRAAIVPKEAKDSTAANNKSKVCDENNQVVKIEHTGLRISSKKKLNLKDSIRFRVNRASSLQKHKSVFEEADEHSCSSEILTAEHVVPASLDSRAKATNKVHCSSGVNVVHEDRRRDEDGLTSSANSLPCDNLKNLKDVSTRKAEKRPLKASTGDNKDIKRKKMICPLESSTKLYDPRLSHAKTITAVSDLKTVSWFRDSDKTINRKPVSPASASALIKSKKRKRHPTLASQKNTHQTIKPHSSFTEAPTKLAEANEEQVASCSKVTTSNCTNTVNSTAPLLFDYNHKNVISITEEKINKTRYSPSRKDVPCNQQSSLADTTVSVLNLQKCDVKGSSSPKDVDMDGAVVTSDVNKPSPVNRSPQQKKKLSPERRKKRSTEQKKRRSPQRLYSVRDTLVNKVRVTCIYYSTMSLFCRRLLEPQL